MQKETQDLFQRLASQVDANVAIRLADRIQKHWKAQPELTAMCDFSQAQRMRRLATIPLVSWRPMESRWAQQALKEIERLSKLQGDPATLALACFGIQRDGLSKALKALEPKLPKVSSKPGKDETIGLPSPTEDEEIDADTAAALEALQAEVGKLR